MIAHVVEDPNEDESILRVRFETHIFLPCAFLDDNILLSPLSHGGSDECAMRQSDAKPSVFCHGILSWCSVIFVFISYYKLVHKHKTMQF